MADEVLIEQFVHMSHELFRINSGAMRFKVKGEAAKLWLVAKEEPYKELYEINLAPVGKIKNMQSNEIKKFRFRHNINNEDFTDFWISWYNYKVRFGFAGQHAALLELDCSDKVSYHDQIGYIKFNSPRTRFLNRIWIVEAPPITYTSLPPIVQKHIDGGELSWTPMTSARLPDNAMIGGFEDEPTYIARSHHNGSLCPGRYIPSRSVALIPWGFQAHQKQTFEILCGFDAEWVKTKKDDIPQNAFIAGYSEVDHEPLYIGRAMHLGHLLTGKVHTLYKLCYLPFEGREIAVSSYEILALADGQRHYNDIL